MEERNVVGGAAAVAFGSMMDFYASLAPYMLLALVLIVVDLRFGVAKAKAIGEVIRTSRVVRRSINKVVDYICWITLAGLFGSSFGTLFGVPLLSGCMLLIVYGIEINSCYNNYFEARGIKKKFNVFKLFKQKIDTDLEECIEDKKDEKTGDN
jgi:hypothetical protein